jgi:hypothetical protein
MANDGHSADRIGPPKPPVIRRGTPMLCFAARGHDPPAIQPSQERGCLHH